jgi:NNP family nitrate/nitrite transporter-like MFS transporter
MTGKDFLKAGHTPTLFSAFLYFDLSFMVWVILGPLGVAISKDLHLNPAQKGFMVAVPLLAGAFLRLVNGVLVDHIGPKKTASSARLSSWPAWSWPGSWASIPTIRSCCWPWS